MPIINNFPASAKQGQSFTIGDRYTTALVTADDPDDNGLTPIYSNAIAAYSCLSSVTRPIGVGTLSSAPRGKSYTITILSVSTSAKIYLGTSGSSGSKPTDYGTACVKYSSQVSVGDKYKVVVDTSYNQMHVYDSNNTLLGTSGNMTSSSTHIFYIAAIIPN